MQWNDEPQTPSVFRQNINHLEGGVIVPGLQAAITGFVCGLAALALSAWLQWPYWAVGGTVAAVTMAGAWLSFRGRWQWLLERITGADLNADGYIGQPLPPALPAPQPEKITVELVQNKGTIGERGDYIDLPYPERLPQFARTVLEGRQYTQSAMVGQGKLFRRDEYDTLIDALVAGGLMRWKNPEHHNIGAVPTAAGRAVLKRFIPSPTGGDDQ